MKRSHRPRGFVLPSAIFLLVVLAALGAFALSLSGAQHLGAALDLQGEHAYRAAQSGIEFGLYQATSGNCGSTTIGFPGGALAGYSAAVDCTPATARELATTVMLYRITATACNEPPCPNPAPSGNYVERQLAAVVAR
jgi:MSHA biogenesis protein MshP